MVGTADKPAPALEQLAEYRQWVGWEYREQRKRKAPINPHTWRDADTTDPATWGTYEEAKSAGNKVGFVFCELDPFTGIDLDDCVEDGEVLPWAMEIVKALDSYTEISPSNTGLKIWVRGSKPGEKCRSGSIEVYDRNRFFTFTGRTFHKGSVEDRQEELDRFYSQVFPATEHRGINTVVAGGGFAGEDEELLSKARSSSAKVRGLYDSGDVGICRGDHSKADNLLCWHLAFWTGHDAERMDRLFRASRLMRPKWDERRGNSTYGDDTIAHAIKTQPNSYDPKNYKAEVKDDIRGVLDGCMEVAVSGKWSGRSGPTDSAVYRALINVAGEYGRKVSDMGVKVSASLRDLALGSGIGRRATISDALKRLEAKEVIRRVYDGGTRKASEYILLTRNRTINNRVNKYGTPLSQTVLIRNPGRTYGTIGKRSAQIIDYVHTLGRVVTADELAKHFETRKNNLKTRNLNTLIALELLKEEDGGYITPEDIEERLERELEESGCNRVERLQRQKYEIERQGWRTQTTVLIPNEVVPVDFQQGQQELIKNVPPKSPDGIIRHTAECTCWMCEDDAPEYVPIIENERVA